MDTIDVSDDYDKIAEIYVRLGPEEIVHTRSSYSLFDLLGSIGGVTFFLTAILQDFFGGMLYYNMVIELMG